MIDRRSLLAGAAAGAAALASSPALAADKAGVKKIQSGALAA